MQRNPDFFNLDFLSGQWTLRLQYAVVICLTHENGIEGGKGGELDVRGGGISEAKCLAEGTVQTFCIHKLAHGSLLPLIQTNNHFTAV